MEILWWLAPAAAATLLAMLWAARAGRPKPERADAAAYERFVRAITREHPAAHLPRPAPRTDHSTGIAVRRSPPE